LPYLGAHKGLAAATVAAVVMVTLASLLAPWPMKVLIDSVFGDHPLPRLFSFPGLAENRFLLMVVVVVSGFLIVLLQNSINVFREYVNTKLKLKITLDFRGDLFQHAQRLSLAFHNSTYSGKLVYLVNNQSNAVAGLLVTLPTLGQSTLTFIGMFLIVIMIDYQLALTSLFVIPFLLYSVKSYASRIHRPLHKVKDLESQTLSMIQEAMSMLRVVVAFGRENFEWRRFRNQGKQALNARIDVTVRQSLFGLTVNLITAAGMALVVGLGATHILRGTLTVGELLVVIAYISSIYHSLGTISSTVGALQDQVVSMQRAFELLDTESEITECEDAKVLSGVRGGVEFEGVDFSYEGKADTLSDISFRVEPGQYVAIVGPTGAGKTTLASLRFHDPDKGRILIDGEDTRLFGIQSLRRQISIVEQNPILFVGTISENIQYGRLGASREEVISAAKAANAHDFIMRLPDQYDSEIGECGAGLSGGERQRISIARAFLKDAPLLILDEPTSFIDARTEAQVLRALSELRRGRTTFIISHRIATIQDADRILVLSNGRIVDEGTHAELEGNEGLYRDFNSIPLKHGQN
jgi:ABC-type multidrug transport system fused ATPase/permease subunit